MTIAQESLPPAQAAPGTAGEAGRRRARFLDRSTPPTLFTLIAVSAIGPVSMNIFLPSLPSMAEWFQADYAVVQLNVSVYLAAMALTQLVVGPISDRFGRRPALIGAFAVMALATVGCLLATTIEVFLAFRMGQAGAAAGLVLSRAMIRDLHGTDRSASLIGYVTMAMAVGPMLSPAIGGALEAAFGWQANFVALLVFALVVLVLAWGDAGETNATPSASMLDQARAYPELLRSRRFWGYALCAAGCSGAFFSFLGGAPWVAANVLGLPPEELGLWFGAIAGGYMTGNFISGRYSMRMGVNRMILCGTLVATTTMTVCLTLFLNGATHPLALFGPVFFVGLGNGMTIPNATAGTLSVRPHLAGSASGLGSTLMVGGGAVFAAVTGALLKPGTGAIPLVAMMLGASVASVVAMLYVRHVERVRGPLPGETR
jgi:DHA1 family bicyclomycin/chloramphenicol resistance-like MFS transporter